MARLLVESAPLQCFTHSPTSLHIGVAHQDGSQSPAPSITVGGFVLFRELHSSLAADRGLAWQLQTQPSELQLADVSLTEGVIGKCVKLTFSDALYPSCTFAMYGESLLCFTLQQGGSITRIQLPYPERLSPGTSVLSRLDTCGGVTTLHISEHLKALEAPSAFTAADEHLCIAGANGTVACVPFSSFEKGAVERVVLLQPSSWALKRLISNFISSTAKSAVISAFQVPGQHGKQLLALLHEDSTFRVWDVSRQTQVMQEALLSDAPAQHSAPVQAVLCPATSVDTAHVVLVEYRVDDALQQSNVVAYCISAQGPKLQLAGRTRLQQPVGGDGRLLHARVHQGGCQHSYQAGGTCCRRCFILKIFKHDL